MIGALERMGFFLRAPDARSREEIEADIASEIEFHVAECARDLEREGLDPATARAEALRRFGNVDEVRRACTRVEIGERIVLQRIQLASTAVLALAVVFLAWTTVRAQAAMREQSDVNRALLERLQHSDSRVADDRVEDVLRDLEQMTKRANASEGLLGALFGSAPRTPEDWLALFDQQRDSWRHGLDVASRIAASDDAAVDALLTIWPRISEPQREQAMKPFVLDGGHPRALEVLHAGATDTGEVRDRAFLYLRRYAFRDLSIGETTYADWHARNADRPLAEVLVASLRAAADRITRADEAERENVLDWVDDVDPHTFERAGLDLGRALIDSGVSDALDRWAHAPRTAAANAGYQRLRGWIEAAQRAK